jgi:pyrimidine-nucleoside phosphorylase
VPRHGAQTRSPISRSAQELIERKRDGHPLSASEWSALMHDFAAGEVPDYQVAALLMACYFRGLEDGETVALTDAMLSSGNRLQLDHLSLPRIDKHSTGGVGDKVSLVLAPLMAAMGIAVPMMSGRGLGHTGGTLDKLESIPGFRTDLTLADARRQVERLGCALIGQTAEIAPADRRLYALRNATATIEVIPLIAASIMSKKLAEGLTGLVLDVKAGSGAFLPEVERGLALAETMIRLGESHGCPTVSLITAMDRPLGHACGNALEVEESIALLRGEGPVDLAEVTFALGAEMLLLAGLAEDREGAVEAQRQTIASGRAAEKFARIIEAQGGNPSVVDDPAVLPQAPVTRVWRAPRGGVVTAVEPRRIGRGVVALRGGRTRLDDSVDPRTGFVITARPGQRVSRDEPLATIHGATEEDGDLGAAVLNEAIQIADEMQGMPLPLISHRVTAAGVQIY